MTLALIQKEDFYIQMALVEIFFFLAEMSSSAHTNNKARNILVLGRDLIQRIDGTTIYAEKLSSINFSEF